ncbi:winged helix-turn-helix transcriptional regulator [Candidatus Woesearchaeota archaeon]|nr:winged helix-turn-helix transcriptional regulator [Candidatus Woesearchaeota archaeon]
MNIFSQRITIIRVRKPAKKDVNAELQWFGDSLGLFNLRDKDKSCFRIFIELLKATRTHRTISSDAIAYKLGLSRGTVIHHINKLIDAGIVINEGSGYLLRVDRLEHLIDEIEKDIQRTCSDLRGIARNIDENI